MGQKIGLNFKVLERICIPVYASVYTNSSRNEIFSESCKEETFIVISNLLDRFTLVPKKIERFLFYTSSQVNIVINFVMCMLDFLHPFIEYVFSVYQLIFRKNKKFIDLFCLNQKHTFQIFTSSYCLENPKLCDELFRFVQFVPIQFGANVDIF